MANDETTHDPPPRPTSSAAGGTPQAWLGEDPATGPVDVSRALTDAMERAGVHPAYVAAVRRCGFVYTQENGHTLTPAQVSRWDAAIEAWFVAHPDHTDISRQARPGPGPDRD